MASDRIKLTEMSNRILADALMQGISEGVRLAFQRVDFEALIKDAVGRELHVLVRAIEDRSDE